jgi:uncharacterized protein YceK
MKIHIESHDDYCDGVNRHPLTPLRLFGMVVLSLIASVVAIAIAIAILAYLILLGGVGTVSSLETTVHGSERSARASSRSRPVRTTPGGTALLDLSPVLIAGEGALPPAPGPRPDIPRRPGGAA